MFNVILNIDLYALCLQFLQNHIKLLIFIQIIIELELMNIICFRLFSHNY